MLECSNFILDLDTNLGTKSGILNEKFKIKRKQNGKREIKRENAHGPNPGFSAHQSVTLCSPMPPRPDSLMCGAQLPVAARYSRSRPFSSLRALARGPGTTPSFISRWLVGPNCQNRPQPNYRAWRHAWSSRGLLDALWPPRDLIGSRVPSSPISPLSPALVTTNIVEKACGATQREKKRECHRRHRGFMVWSSFRPRFAIGDHRQHIPLGFGASSGDLGDQTKVNRSPEPHIRRGAAPCCRQGIQHHNWRWVCILRARAAVLIILRW
jgi:hypothetical protein